MSKSTQCDIPDNETESTQFPPAHNDEFKVYMDINLYENNVIVPDQELFGEIPGYFGTKRDQRKWLITSAKIDGKNSATLEIVNDYGSEDLTATLTYNPEDMLHYTTVKTTMFNGVTHPAIMLARPDGELLPLRDFSYEDYKNRMD